MRRRNLILGAALALATGRAALAQFDDDEDIEVGPNLELLQVPDISGRDLAGAPRGTGRVRRLLLLGDATADVFSLDLPAVAQNEYRFGLITPTVPQRFAGAEEVGRVRLGPGPALFADLGGAGPARQVVILAGPVSYWLPLRRPRARLPRLPEGLPVVGQVLRRPGEGPQPVLIRLDWRRN